MTAAEGVYVEPLGCYIVLEQLEGQVKRIYFSVSPPKTGSMLAAKIADHLINGSPCQIDLDLSDLPAFQRKVFNAILAIPRGKTTSYGDVAELIGMPKAARAVGGALGANPFAVIIPCHRVLSKNGLGGYRWGVEIKKKLLACEATDLVTPKASIK
jgi:O-6-methylguanine DNA methyltransferase